MKQIIYIWGTALIFGVVATNANAAGKYSSQKDRLSYAIGVQIGNNLKSGGLTEIDSKVLGEAVGDVLKGHKLRVSAQDMEAAMKAFQQKKLAEREAMAAKNKEAGDKYMAKNKKKKGVKVTKDGIQYEVLKAGTGEHPKSTDTVTVNYVGKLVNGKVFDSTAERHKPASFTVNGVIKGWAEILPMMKVGAKWRVVIPPDLAYGPRGAGHVIGPNETLIFDIELLKINKK